MEWTIWSKDGLADWLNNNNNNNKTEVHLYAAYKRLTAELCVFRYRDCQQRDEKDISWKWKWWDSEGWKYSYQTK